MNTQASVYYGWVFLAACGAGSYYFAKRSVTADRLERQRAEVQRQMARNRHLAAGTHQGAQATPAEQDQEKARAKAHLNEDTLAGAQPAKSGGEERRQEPESKYEARVPFRSKKGDRFS